MDKDGAEDGDSTEDEDDDITEDTFAQLWPSSPFEMFAGLRTVALASLVTDVTVPNCTLHCLNLSSIVP